MKWTVDQKVYVAYPINYGTDRGQYKLRKEATITKIGKRWATIDLGDRHRSYRFDMHTGVLDGEGYGPAVTVWPSPEAIDTWIELTKEWKAFLEVVRRSYGRLPRSFTPEQVRTWREALEAALKDDDDET